MNSCLSIKHYLFLLLQELEVRALYDRIQQTRRQVKLNYSISLFRADQVGRNFSAFEEAAFSLMEHFDSHDFPTLLWVIILCALHGFPAFVKCGQKSLNDPTT